MDKDDAHHTIMMAVMGVIDKPRHSDELKEAIKSLGWQLMEFYVPIASTMSASYYARRKIEAKDLPAFSAPHFSGYIHRTKPFRGIGPYSFIGLVRAIAREEGIINAEETQGA